MKQSRDIRHVVDQGLGEAIACMVVVLMQRAATDQTIFKKDEMEAVAAIVDSGKVTVHFGGEADDRLDYVTVEILP